MPRRPTDQAELPFEADGPGAVPAAPRRVFLGWDRPPLAAAADWLLAEHADDLEDLIVALPGARAAGRLLQLLARRSDPGWTPPRLVTQGDLIDELVRLERPVAERLARTLAWERALASTPEAERWLGSTSGTDGLRLAETVRALHGELAPEGKGFDTLARGSSRLELEEEAKRWEVLAEAQERYRGLLDELGLEDPHEGRLRAVERGRIDRARRVVLVGVADMTHLLARLLQEIRERTTILVVAPEAAAEGFDDLGRLRAAYWRDRDVPLDLERWRVAEKPVDQADAVSAVLAAHEGRFAASDVAIGVPDESVVPYLERRLGEAGAVARNAAGTPAARTRPVRLVRAAARDGGRGDFADLAALARDPDLDLRLVHGGDPAARLDEYHREHLPRSGREGWIEDRRSGADVLAIQQGVDELLAELASGEERPLASWAGPVRAFLQGVYREPLDPEVEAERVVGESLRLLSRRLAELEEVPAGLAGPEVGAAEAIELLVRAVRADRIPPPPRKSGRTRAGARAGAPTVELLGWLDVPLDDAPAVVVTGFNEGRVPRSIGGHPFLPDSTRRRLGLADDEDRLARDVYASTVLLSTGREVCFVTGRRSAEGDPLVPSRLAFHRPEDEIPARVRHFLPAEEELRSAEEVEEGAERFACPRVERFETPEVMSVSSFRTYLGSPYRFFVDRVLKLETVDDRARELDPMRFGSLAHDVLEDFGKEGPRDSQSHDEIADFLRERVDALVARRFGASPLPAVALQAEQLKYRLGIFARRQAERRRAGWRIVEVEWEREPLARLEVDGEPMAIRGRIDRIDAHDDGRWAVLDYKTGEKTGAPDDAHRRRGAWVDLQLPLYRLLTEGLYPGEPELGYCTLGTDEASIAFRSADWTRADLDEALATARDVVRAVRAGAFWEPGRTPYEEILKAIWGASMIVTSEGEEA